jgi:hypothetical protein
LNGPPAPSEVGPLAPDTPVPAAKLVDGVATFGCAGVAPLDPLDATLDEVLVVPSAPVAPADDEPPGPVEVFDPVAPETPAAEASLAPPPLVAPDAPRSK